MKKELQELLDKMTSALENCEGVFNQEVFDAYLNLGKMVFNKEYFDKVEHIKGVGMFLGYSENAQNGTMGGDMPILKQIFTQLFEKDRDLMMLMQDAAMESIMSKEKFQELKKDITENLNEGITQQYSIPKSDDKLMN